MRAVPRPSPAPARAIAWALLPAGAVAYALSFSWGRWGDIVVDWGRELEIAHQLAGGRALAGLVYWYGPLAPHLNALLFTIAGVRTSVLQGAGVVSLLAMAGLLWALAYRLAGAPAAALAATAFVSLCAFGHYYVSDIFNWVTPYAYPATYGMVLATASLYALVRHSAGAGTRSLTISLVLLALALVTKLEPALAALAGHVAFVACRISTGQARLAPLAVRYGTVAAVAAAILATTLVRRDGGAGVTLLLNARTLAPVLRYMGIGDGSAALGAMLASAIGLGCCVLAPYVLARASARAGRVLRTAAVLGCVLVPVLVLFRHPPETVLRGVPLLIVAALVESVARFARRPSERAAREPEIVLLAFAAAALARLPFSAGAHHYGFYLLPVPLTALIVLAFRRLPDLLPGGTWSERLLAAGMTATIATLCWTHTSAAAAMYAGHTARVATPRGQLMLLGNAGGVPVGTLYTETVARLRAYPPATTVLAAPEGTGLTFLAGLRMWGDHFSYYPPEMSPETDRRLRAALEREPPDLVVLLNLIDLGHYGARGFGVDYATASVAWIQQHYEPDRILPGNTVVIARRRGLVPPP
jgi:hypothetical protein